MKKTLAMLLAVASTMSVGVTAFADDVTSMEEVISSSSDVSIPETQTSSSEVSSSEVSSSEASSSEASSSEAEIPAVNPSAFVFGADADGVILGDTILEPGKEYKFPASMVFGDKTLPITEDMIKDYKFTYSKVSSNGVSTFEIDEEKGVYYLYVEIKASTPLKPVDVKYNVKLVNKSNNLSVFGQEVKFQYGYEEANGDYVNGLDKGDIVEIDNNAPVITANQFDKIAKINDYKNVTMSGSEWKFTVNVTDETTKNMVHNNAGIKDILAKFPDHDFKFYNFGGKPAFAATGRLELDVEDIVDEFSNMYVYRYADGKLYRINATFNGDENTMSFRTNKLDSFVISNKLIKDGTVVTKPGNDNSSSDEDKDENTDKTNPTTGASNMIDAAVMTAIASLAAAGTMVAKKRSK